MKCMGINGQVISMDTQTDTPEGGLDHLIDAVRYVAMSKLSLKSQKKGVYSINII